MAGFNFPDLTSMFEGTSLDPAVAAREFATFARSERDALIASGAASANYETYVNNREGAPEESVVMPGPIVYVFSNWKVAIEAALEMLRQFSESRGKYADSFIVTVNGNRVADFSAIPANGEVVILNAQPFTRKMEVGGNKTGKRHFERAKGQFNGRFSGVFKASTMFLNAKSGIDPRIPYILKGQQRDASVGALAEWHGVPKAVILGWRAQGRKISGPVAKSRRKDTEAGQPITYPALVINIV